MLVIIDLIQICKDHFGLNERKLKKSLKYGSFGRLLIRLFPNQKTATALEIVWSPVLDLFHISSSFLDAIVKISPNIQSLQLTDIDHRSNSKLFDRIAKRYPNLNELRVTKSPGLLTDTVLFAHGLSRLQNLNFLVLTSNDNIVNVDPIADYISSSKLVSFRYHDKRTGSYTRLFESIKNVKAFDLYVENQNETGINPVMFTRDLCGAFYQNNTIRELTIHNTYIVGDAIFDCLQTCGSLTSVYFYACVFGNVPENVFGNVPENVAETSQNAPVVKTHDVLSSLETVWFDGCDNPDIWVSGLCKLLMKSSNLKTVLLPRCTLENRHFSMLCNALSGKLLSLFDVGTNSITEINCVDFSGLNVNKLSFANNQIKHINPDAMHELNKNSQQDLLLLDFSNNPVEDYNWISRVPPRLNIKSLGLRDIRWDWLVYNIKPETRQALLGHLTLKTLDITLVHPYIKYELDVCVGYSQLCADVIAHNTQLEKFCCTIEMYDEQPPPYIKINPMSNLITLNVGYIHPRVFASLLQLPKLRYLYATGFLKTHTVIDDFNTEKKRVCEAFANSAVDTVSLRCGDAITYIINHDGLNHFHNICLSDWLIELNTFQYNSSLMYYDVIYGQQPNHVDVEVYTHRNRENAKRRDVCLFGLLLSKNFEMLHS